VLAFQGTLAPDPLVATSRVQITGTIDPAGASFQVLPGAGALVLEDGGVIRNAVVTGTGTLSAGSHTTGGAALENVTLGANLRLDSQSLVSVSGGLTLDGVLAVASANNQDATLRFVGTQTVGGSGTLLFPQPNNAYENEAQADVGAVVTLGPQLRVRTQSGGDGQLSGGGAYVLEGVVRAESSGSQLQVTAPLQNLGRLEAAPGALLQFLSGLTLDPAGTLAVELGGAAAGSFGRVTVTGAAALDGALELALVDGFLPELGNRFQIMTFGSRSGGFDTLQGTGIGGGLVFQLDESQATDLELEVVAE
jgi:hypothetical protein